MIFKFTKNFDRVIEFQNNDLYLFLYNFIKINLKEFS